MSVALLEEEVKRKPEDLPLTITSLPIIIDSLPEIIGILWMEYEPRLRDENDPNSFRYRVLGRMHLETSMGDYNVTMAMFQDGNGLPSIEELRKKGIIIQDCYA